MADAAEKIESRLEEEVELIDGEMISVRIAEFYSPKAVPFDLHLKMGAGKYLRVFRAGESFSPGELKAYEIERGVKQVYFAAKHRQGYISSSMILLEKLIPLPAVLLNYKFGVARILSELYMQELFSCKEEERVSLIEKGKTIAKLIAQWVEAEPKLQHFLIKLPQVDSTTESMNFLSALFACLLAKRFSWTSRRTFESLITAAFFCDIGLFALPAECSRLKPKRMNASQRKQYETHPELSYQMLVKCGKVPENVLTIVREHHEYCDGSGFPNQLALARTLMYSRTFVLAAELVRTASEYLLPPDEAIKVLFPHRSVGELTAHPELVAKFDRELLLPFLEIFGCLEGGSGA